MNSTTLDFLASLRAYHRERNARISACTGGLVTKLRHTWYCDSCGEEFDTEAQATAPKHAEPCEGDECKNPKCKGDDQ